MTDHHNRNSFGDDRRAEDRCTEDRHAEELDRALDAALRNYALIEPRPGLEDRILANLHSEPEPRSHASWWQWGLVAAIAALVIVVVSLAWSPKASHPQIANHPSPTIESPTKTPAKPEVRPDRSAESVPPRIKPVRRAAAHDVVPVVASSPKLDQFPSPQPLTAEELILVRYVSQFPQDATLTARVQEELEIEIHQKMQEPRSAGELSSLNQQER